MRSSKIRDIDGEQFPDPLTINYQAAIDSANSVPGAHEVTFMDLKKLWLMYYKETGKLELDDVLYSINGIEHVGELEPGDIIYMYSPEDVKQFSFKDLA